MLTEQQIDEYLDKSFKTKETFNQHPVLGLMYLFAQDETVHEYAFLINSLKTFESFRTFIKEQRPVALHIFRSTATESVNGIGFPVKASSSEEHNSWE